MERDALIDIALGEADVAEFNTGLRPPRPAGAEVSRLAQAIGGGLIVVAVVLWIGVVLWIAVAIRVLGAGREAMRWVRRRWRRLPWRTRHAITQAALVVVILGTAAGLFIGVVGPMPG